MLIYSLIFFLMATTIKVKIRLSKLADKPATIFYQITRHRRVKHITTDIHIFPNLWNYNSQRPKEDDHDSMIIANRIDSDVNLLNNIIRDLDNDRIRNNTDFSVEDVINRFRSPERRVSVTNFMEEQIELLLACNKPGTARNYRSTLDNFLGFLNGKKLYFQEMTTQLIERYNDYLLRKGIVRNSLSFYMRILRSVYNKAVRIGLTDQAYPFRNVYTGIDRTRKRAVNENVIAQLIKLDLSHSDPLALARDMFLFSFYTRGMAFVDIAYLKKSNIHDGHISYARHKTGQLLSVKIEPCIQIIISRYNSKVSDSPYIFPILKSEKCHEAYKQYETALRYYNRLLRKLSIMIGLNKHLSSYVARHSWATMARNHNIPVSVISAGMGHSSERTTEIYLAMLENSVIDSANHGILEALNNSISQR